MVSSSRQHYQLYATIPHAVARKLIMYFLNKSRVLDENFWSWFFKMEPFLQYSVSFSRFWCSLHSSDPKNKNYDGFFLMIFTQLFGAVFKSAPSLFIWVTSPPSRRPVPSHLHNLQAKRRQAKFWKKIPPTPPHRSADNTALSVHFQGLNNCTVINRLVHHLLEWHLLISTKGNTSTVRLQSGPDIMHQLLMT